MQVDAREFRNFHRSIDARENKIRVGGHAPWERCMIDRGRVSAVNHRQTFDIREFVEWHGWFWVCNNRRTSAEGFSVRNGSRHADEITNRARIASDRCSNKFIRLLFAFRSFIYRFLLEVSRFNDSTIRCRSFPHFQR